MAQNERLGVAGIEVLSLDCEAAGSRALGQALIGHVYQLKMQGCRKPGPATGNLKLQGTHSGHQLKSKRLVSLLESGSSWLYASACPAAIRTLDASEPTGLDTPFQRTVISQGECSF